MSQPTSQREESQIIDIDIRGKSVKFFLGVNGKQWGDDWNDAPYEHNAGSVYQEHVKSEQVIVFDFDDIVVEPCYGHGNSPWSKEDMIKGLVPCLVVLKAKYAKKLNWRSSDTFEGIVAHCKAERYYFGDILSLPSLNEES